MADTSIEWTDKTWNPVVGCTKISPGCKNCYAKTLHDQRHKAHGEGKRVPPQYAHPFEVVQTMPDRLTDPLSWRAPKKVFVNSVSDLFHDDIPEAFIDQVFGVMALARRHTFQVLTKRPARMAAYIARLRADSEGRWFYPALFEHVSTLFRDAGDEATRERFLQAAHDHQGKSGWPLPNVWLGTSVENQAATDERIPYLLRTPAEVRFLSCEPLLGAVDLRRHLTPLVDTGEDIPRAERREWDLPTRLPGIDWVIVGGESGADARPCNVEWVRSVVQQCRAAGTAVFVKQLGAKPYDPSAANGVPGARDERTLPVTREDLRVLAECLDAMTMRLADKKGGEMSEWPSDLRVREFPEVPRA